MVLTIEEILLDVQALLKQVDVPFNEIEVNEVVYANLERDLGAMILYKDTLKGTCIVLRGTTDYIDVFCKQPKTEEIK